MKKKPEVNPQDKEKVLQWMLTYCFGFRNARTRQNILPFVRLPDRYFRQIISELKHEGQIASTCDKGYWAIPLVTKDKEEIEAALDSYQEMRSKALDMLTGIDMQIKILEDKKRCLTEQLVLAGI